MVERTRRPLKKKYALDDTLDRGLIWLIIGVLSIYCGFWLAVRAAKGPLGLWHWLVRRAPRNRGYETE